MTKSNIPSRRILPTLVAFGLGIAATGTAQAQTQIGIGSDHAAGDVDSAGSRMNIENSDDTFPSLPTGTYDVTDFKYSTSAAAADIQPFLAVSTADDEYSVIWAGPTEESPGTDDTLAHGYSIASARRPDLGFPAALDQSFRSIL
jgi:hypothetical protein